MSSSESDTENDDRDLQSEQIVNRLTELVRKQYRMYLEKILQDNYEHWCQKELGFREPPLHKDIVKCAEIYEKKAIKACMIAQFYRKSMLAIMGRIQKETKTGKLSRHLQQIIQNQLNPQSATSDASTQTEYIKRVPPKPLPPKPVPPPLPPPEANDSNEMRYECLTLQQKIDMFQERLTGRENIDETSWQPKFPDTSAEPSQRKKRRRHSPKERKTRKNPKKTKVIVPIEDAVMSPYCLTPISDVVQKIEDDDIAKNLDMLFKEEKTELDEIFGSPEPDIDPRIENILKEIEQSQIPKKSDSNPIESNPPMQTQLKIDEEKKIDVLKDSLWPCELHRQQLRLREAISRFGDRDFRYHERLKMRFFELFGADDDDEFAPYSPTLELNDTLLASCKKRIAPWIVRHLMPPLNDGLIANRYLFKKLAKRLAHNIVLENQYSDENHIRRVIAEFFCMRSCVNSIEDIDAAG